MKTSLKVILAATALSLTACTEQEKTTEVRTITVQSAMDSDELTTAAEQLISPYTFMLADKVLAQALEKDPLNKKAIFLKALIKPMMVYKGIYQRAMPMAKSYGDIAKWEKAYSNLPNSPLKDFLLAPAAGDITDSESFLKFLDSYRDSFLEIKKAARELRGETVTITLNPHIWESVIKNNMIQACLVSNTGNDESRTYEVHCDYSDIATVKANEADFIAIEQIAAGNYALLAMYTAYGLDGSERFFKNSALLEGLSPVERNNKLFSNSKFGTLRKTQGLSQLKALGSDYVSAVKYAFENDSVLCKKFENEIPNMDLPRRKGFLFERGFCIDDKNKAAESIAKLEEALKGPVDVPVKIKDSNEETIKINYFAILDNPVADIRTIMPAEYDNCGNATRLKDPSYNGLFPNGDDERLLANNPDCRK